MQSNPPQKKDSTEQMMPETGVNLKAIISHVLLL